MQQGETIYDVQKRFTHIVNHLTGLGKTFDTDELNIKILKSSNKTWQPKVTSITESQNLATMTMAALFGKLREHELELGRLNEEEDIGRNKNIAFKTKVVKGKKQKEEEDSDDDENLSLMIKKFTKFMKAKGKNQFKNNKKENQGSSSNFKCYGYGKSRHVKADCPNSKKSEEKKGRKFFKKKTFIAWEDNASSTSNSSDSDNEEANLFLMANHDDSDNEVSSTCNGNDYDDLYDAFQQLLVKSSKLDTAHRKLKYDFKDLQSKFEKSLKEEEILKNKISILETKKKKLLNVLPVKVTCLIYVFWRNILKILWKIKTVKNLILRKIQIRPSMLIIIIRKIKLKELAGFG